MLIKRTRGWELPEREATPESVFLNRRTLLTGTAGLIGAVGLTRVLNSLLFDTDARDPWTLALTALVLMIVAVVAAVVPAVRGTRVSPIQALREQ